MSEKRTCGSGFFLAHATTGCCCAIISVFILDQHDGAIGRTASFWVAQVTYLACASIGVFAWWTPAKLLLASGRFRGPGLLVAVLSGVASMLALILFVPDAGDPLAWLAIAAFVPASLGLVWTTLSIVDVASGPRPANAGGAPQADAAGERRSGAGGSRPKTSDSGMIRRMVAGITLCCLLPATLVMIQVERGLLASGVLNTKDLAPFVGNEPGTVLDYVLNAWYWDGALLALFLLSVPSSVVGIWMIATRKRRAAISPHAA